MRHNTSHTPHPRGGRVAWRRALVVSAVIAGTAVAAAACGGSTAAPPAHLTAYQREFAYAECMRAHGDPGFPNPQSDGTFNSTTANANAFHGTLFLSANKACAHLEGPGVTPAQQEQFTLQALKFAACMRAHGITGFQYSPVRNGTSGALGVQGGGAGDLGSPQFQSAQRACRKLSPSGS
jgi:hypothetical protein